MSAIGSSLVAASLLLGQSSTVPGSGLIQATNSPAPASFSNAPPLTPARGWFGLDRLRLFARQPGQQAPCGCANRVPHAASPAGGYAPLTTNGARLSQAQAPSLPRVTVEAAPQGPLVIPAAAELIPQAGARDAGVSSPILPALVNKMGRDEKFAWVTGQLEIEDGQRVIYYAPPEFIDPCKGRVLLHTDVDVSALGQGDLVSAAGQLQGAPGPNAVFVATSVTLIESPWQSGK